MPTFVLLPEEQQTLLATAGQSVQDESEKSDEYAFLVERMPAMQVPLGATILILQRGPDLGELQIFPYLSTCPIMSCVVQKLPGDRTTFAICSNFTVLMEASGPGTEV